MNHWIIAPVILPAIMAPLLALAMRHDLVLQRIFSMAAAVGLLLISGGLMWDAAISGPQVYLLGNWPAPFGIVLVLDRLSAMMVGLTALLAVMVLLYVLGSGWDARGRNFHPLFQFQLMGICGAFLTGDAFNLFVFFEVLLIASYGLMIHAGGGARLKAGVQYVAYNLAGSALFLIALATIYGMTGTLNMADLSHRLSVMPEGDAALVRVAGALLLIVFAVKGALVPFQFWLPGTYALAPGPVAALFAIMTKVGAYAVLRFYTLIFGPEIAYIGTFYADLIMPAAILSLIIGVVGILGARDLARLAAFAAIASMGTLFIAIAAFDPVVTASALYYLVHSTLGTAMMFLVVDLVLAARGTSRVVAMPGFAGRGLLGALFMLAAIAMAGMPPLSGFLGKLMILDTLSARDDRALLWTVILATSLLSIIGMARAGSLVFWTTTEAPARTEAPRPLALVAVFALLAGLVVMTVAAGPVSAWMEATAAELHDTEGYVEAVLGTEQSQAEED